MRRALTASATAALLLLLTGCGALVPRTSTTTIIVQETAAPGSPSPVPAPPTIAPIASPTPSEVDPAPFETEDGTTTTLAFDTVDRNLHCGVVDTGDADGYYGCVIGHRTYSEPPRGDCEQSFGHGFVAPLAGTPHAACRGDVLFLGETQRVPVLQDGQQLSYGAITCSVADGAVTCGNQRGDGFTLSASAYSIRG